MDQDLLKQLIRNIISKDSFQLILSGNTSEFTIRNVAHIKLDRESRYKVALVNLETYYSFPNIHATNNAFTFSPNDGRTWYTYRIPEGSYEIDDISKHIERVTKTQSYGEARNRPPITLSANPSTLKSIMEIAPRHKVDFRPSNSFRSVLCFNNKVYNAGYNESENIVNTLTVNSIFVEVDIIKGSYVNGKLSPIIYSFFPNVSPGYKIIENPVNLVFLPLNTHSIDKVTVRLTDQDGKLLNLRGETITIRLHIRQV
jgi:hypothetical protein